MKKIFVVLFISVFGLSMLPTSALAQHGHGESAARPQPAMKMASTDVFADGIEATFMVMMNQNHKMMLKNMNMKEDIEPGTTHNIMILVKDEKSGKEFDNIPVTIKMTDPSDNEQTKTGSYKAMMRTYDAYFTMREKGKYQIRVLFETQGLKRSIGISYELT